MAVVYLGHLSGEEERMFFESKQEKELRREINVEIAIQQAENDVRQHERCSNETIKRLLDCAAFALDHSDTESYQLACEGICDAYEGRRSAKRNLQMLANIKLELSIWKSTETTAKALVSSGTAGMSIAEAAKLVSSARIAQATNAGIRDLLRGAIDTALIDERSAGRDLKADEFNSLIAGEQQRRAWDSLSVRLTKLDAILEALDEQETERNGSSQSESNPKVPSAPFQVEIVPASSRQMGAQNVRDYLAALPTHRQVALERWRTDGRYQNLVEGASPKADEQARVAAFMSKRFATLGADVRPPEVAYSTFDRTSGGAAGHGVARYRWAGILSSLKPSERLSVMVHEFAHAVGHVRLRYSENPASVPWIGDRISGDGATGAVSAVREGWIHHVQRHESPFPASRFVVLEEFAACSHEAAWYRNEGWTEKLLPDRCAISMSKDHPWQMSLARAHRWLESPSIGVVDDARCRTAEGAKSFFEWLDGQPVAIPHAGTVFVKGNKSFRLGYSHFRAAIHLLAPELYPAQPAEEALSALENDLCRVQAGLASPAPFLRRLKDRLGSDAAWFFAHLQNDNGSDSGRAIGVSSQFLGLFAESSRLNTKGTANPIHEYQKRRVRELLFEGFRGYIDSCRT